MRKIVCIIIYIVTQLCDKKVILIIFLLVQFEQIELRAQTFE